MQNWLTNGATGSGVGTSAEIGHLKMMTSKAISWRYVPVAVLVAVMIAATKSPAAELENVRRCVYPLELDGARIDPVDASPAAAKGTFVVEVG